MRSCAALAVRLPGVGRVFCAWCCWLSAAFIPPWNQQRIKEVLQRAALIHRRISEASSCCFITIFLSHHHHLHSVHRHLLCQCKHGSATEALSSPCTYNCISLPLPCPPDLWAAAKPKIVGTKSGKKKLRYCLLVIFTAEMFLFFRFSLS